MAALHRPALPAPRALGRHVGGRWLIVVAAGAAVLFALLQVNQFSRATSTGYALDALRQQQAMKQAQNHELEAQVAELSSLGRVSWDARTKLGLVPASKRVYITVNQPVPDRQTLPTRYQQQAAAAAPAATPQAGGAPWWKHILDLTPFR
jgi:cell division protein FtsL